MDGNRLKQLRKKNDLTQEELGKKIGVIKQTVSSWENNISEPNGDTLVLLSKILRTSPDYLLGLSDNSNAISTPEGKIGGYENNIKHWIAKTGFSDDEIAHKLGISKDLLSDYINDKIAIPYHVLVELSDICEVSTDCLLGIINKSREKDFDNVLPFRYNYKIAERIRKLCNESNIDTSSSFLENLLCLSSKEIFYLIEYGFVPHVDTIIKLADYFNVSCDFLLCTIDDQEEKALSAFRMLNEDNKDIVVGEIKKCLKEQRYEESVAADEQLKEAK